MAVPDGLMARMTLAEKIGQLTMVSADLTVTGPVVKSDLEGGVRAGTIGSLFNLHRRATVHAAQRMAVEETRLGVPLFFAFDVIHGHRTIFPMPIGEACAFDPDLWAQTARAAAIEAAGEGIDLTFAPMLDIARDPRWGRIAEGPGEDPLVALRMATAKVRGYRDGLPGARLAVTPKHFVGYGASIAGRDYAPVEMSPRTLVEVHLPAFEAAVLAGADAIMPAFTDLDGIPLTAHGDLLTGRLRDTWGFDGVVISDYNAIAELIRHGVAADLPDAAALALRAGVDIDMTGSAYPEGLPQALARGTITLAQIDAAVTRVLALKDRLGLFADPYLRSRPRTEEEPGRPEHLRTLARRAAGNTLVVMQNQGDVLPFRTVPDRLALIGPLADSPADMLGSWTAAGRAEEAVGVLGGLRAAWPDAAIEYVRGVAVDGTERSGIPAAVAAARRADQVVLCIGEAAWMSGEAASRARIDLPGAQAALASAIFDTGARVTVLVFAGRPLVMPEVFARSAAVVACWYPGSEAGHAVANLFTGRIAPSGRLAVTWPRDVGQIPIHIGLRSGGRPEKAGDRYTTRHIDMSSEPQFPFGHGLAFTHLRLGLPQVQIGARAVMVRVAMHNDGHRPTCAPVFLFLRDPVAAISRPVLELKDFTQVEIRAGSTAEARFVLERDAFTYLDATLRPIFEAGEFLLHAGLSAEPSELRSARIAFSSWPEGGAPRV